MPDTMRGDFPDVACSDCGDEEKGQVYIKHWGPLVPPGEVGYFGPNCWAARMLFDRENPRPLGTPYKYRENLADDMDLISSGSGLLASCGKDKRKLLLLLEEFNAAKERFAVPRQMFDEAAKLRNFEREIQTKLKDQ